MALSKWKTILIYFLGIFYTVFVVYYACLYLAAKYIPPEEGIYLFLIVVYMPLILMLVLMPYGRDAEDPKNRRRSKK